MIHLVKTFCFILALSLLNSCGTYDSRMYSGRTAGICPKEREELLGESLSVVSEKLGAPDRLIRERVTPKRVIAEYDMTCKITYRYLVPWFARSGLFWKTKDVVVRNRFHFENDKFFVLESHVWFGNELIERYGHSSFGYRTIYDKNDILHIKKVVPKGSWRFPKIVDKEGNCEQNGPAPAGD